MKPLEKYRSLNDVWNQHGVLLRVFLGILVLAGLSMTHDAINRITSLKTGEVIPIHVTNVRIETRHTYRAQKSTTVINFNYRENEILEERQLKLNGVWDNIKKGDVIKMRYDRKHDLFTIPYKPYNYFEFLSAILTFLIGAIPLCHYYFIYKRRPKQ